MSKKLVLSAADKALIVMALGYLQENPNPYCATTMGEGLRKIRFDDPQGSALRLLERLTDAGWDPNTPTLQDEINETTNNIRELVEKRKRLLEQRSAIKQKRTQ